MTQPTQQELLNARVHFGHLTSKWHPRFAPYIFMKKNGIHIIDLNQTLKSLARATKAMKEIIQSGKKILFVATKKQPKPLVKALAEKLCQPYVTERWLGGTLTNFVTIRKLLKKLANIDATMQTPTYQHLTKREQLTISRKKNKLERTLKGLSTINRLPAALFVVDIKKEQTCVREARKLNLPIFAIVDTNSCPELADYPIPANDDARSAIAIILNYLETQLLESLHTWQETKEQNTLPIQKETQVKITNPIQTQQPIVTTQTPINKEVKPLEKQEILVQDNTHTAPSPPKK